MSEDAPIYQCPDCRRLFASDGHWLDPKLCVPVMRLCGAEDCARLKKANAERISVRPVPVRRRAAMHHKRRSPVTQSQCHRGMPPERDDAESDGNPVTHAMQQAEFTEGSEAKSQNEVMLRELLRTFDLHDCTRTARSRWICNKEWQEKFGITRPNSRQTELNGSDTHEGHPTVKMHRLFIDSRMQPGSSQVWERSLCYIEHSLLLARERKKEDEHQLEINT